MSVVNTLMLISEWLDEQVCAGIRFKVPPEDRKPDDDMYEYKEITPHAFPMYLPSNDKLPPNIEARFPSICVQMEKGSDDVAAGHSDMKLMLGFSCWNPGVHGLDIYYPEGTGQHGGEKFRKSSDGWMDVWNFIDTARRKIESTDIISGKIQILKNIPVEYGPYRQQDEIPDFYPFWFGYVSFTVRTELVRDNKQIEEFL